MKKAAETARLQAQRLRWGDQRITVNIKALAPDNSYSSPAYVERGYYVDRPFRCCDCDQDEIWTATQQKWWYEIAQGGRWTTAKRCRACRRRERDRKNEARRRSLEGLARTAKK